MVSLVYSVIITITFTSIMHVCLCIFVCTQVCTVSPCQMQTLHGCALGQRYITDASTDMIVTYLSVCNTEFM